MYKEEYEDDFMEQDIVINETLADILNGRCFIDTDMPERIEGFKFVKAKTGIDCIYVGADPFFTYTHVLHEDYGTYKVKDTYFGTDIALVQTNFYLIREIDDELFNQMLNVVNEQKDIVKKVENDFKKKQKEIFRQVNKKFGTNFES